MKPNFSYPGYPYQRKCCCAYLFNALHKAAFQGFALEHPDGDDFDLHYTEEAIYHQCKYEEQVKMREHLGKFFRRYMENIKQAAPDRHRLRLLLSHEHNGQIRKAAEARNCEHPKLKTIRSDVRGEGVAHTVADWRAFLDRLSFQIEPLELIEADIMAFIELHFGPLELPADEYATIRDVLLQEIDRAMVLGEIVSKDEFILKVKTLYSQYSHRLPRFRPYLEKAFNEFARDMVRGQSPSVAAPDTGEAL